MPDTSGNTTISVPSAVALALQAVLSGTGAGWVAPGALGPHTNIGPLENSLGSHNLIHNLSHRMFISEVIKVYACIPLRSQCEVQLPEPVLLLPKVLLKFLLVTRLPAFLPYWSKADWTSAPPAPTVPGQERARRGPRSDPTVNARMRYIYNAAGVMIDGLRARTIRHGFYKFCRYLAEKDRLPQTWAHGIDPVSEDAYHHWMKSLFEECQLCQDSWFADEIAIRNFTTWRRKYLARQAEQASGAARTGQRKRRRVQPDSDDEGDSFVSGDVSRLLDQAQYQIPTEPESDNLGHPLSYSSNARHHTLL
ncbi:hypothetical protein C8Q80DRAFT_1274798 [Daedaleopsis nitida]|nr:hypothetical protein C8Q80DRAFT_1274798 [Daedaleopsis nitida]